MKNSLTRWFIFAALLAGFAFTLNGDRQTQKDAPAVSISPAKSTLSAPISEQRKTAALSAYSKLPLVFEENKGQMGESVQYLSRGNGYSLYLRPDGAVISLRESLKNPQSATSLLRMRMLGARTDAKLSGTEKCRSTSNYFVGTQAYTDIEQFRRVRCPGLYDGVEVVYYGNQKQLEYDFIVAPRADAGQIRMGIGGAEKTEIDAQGNLVMRVAGKSVSQHKPVIYQEIREHGAVVRKAIAGGYRIVSADSPETVVGFELGAYDHSVPLVIDPVLVYATFYGDTPHTDHSGDDVGLAVAIDASGSAYVVGMTNSYEFQVKANIEFVIDPINHSADPLAAHPLPAHYHGFVTKFLPDGSDLVYSTYLAGTGVDSCRGVALDQQNNVFVVGATTSSDFPVKNALHTFAGNNDGFLLKLNPSGSNILFSTFIGGSNDDYANDVVVDASGNVLVTGTTSSPNFTTAHAVQGTFGGGSSDAFVAKFSNDGAVAIYSTFLGGNGDDTGNGIAVDASGNAFVTGSTTSQNFPVASPFQTIIAAGKDAFVTKINASGNLLVFSTYLGGDGDDVGNGIAVDANGNVYVTGSTASTNFPTISPTILPVQSANGGAPGTTDAFVSKFNVYGSALIFSTYLGGSMNDVGTRIRVDSRNAIYVAGTTTLIGNALASQNNFPVAPQTNTLQSGHSGLEDGFVAKFNPTGTPLVYSTYIGSDTHIFNTENGTLQYSAAGGFYYVNLRNNALIQNAAPYSPPDAFNIFVYINGANLVYSNIQYDPSNPNNPAYPGIPVKPDFDTPTSVAINGMAVDNSGNAYLAGSTNGSFYYTFGAYSDIAPSFPIPGEDFPAPHILTRTDSAGNVVPVPHEYNVGLNIDENDIAIAKVGDNSPLITSPLIAQGIKNVNFTYAIAATNSPQSFDAAGLPSGLVVNTASGQIGGIPTVEGTYQVVLTATNPSGTGSQILILIVSSAKPVLTSPLSAVGNVGAVFQFQLTADNNPGAFMLTPSLPVGLNLDSTTGLISGIPVVEGIYNLSVTASNLNGTSQPQNLQIRILPAIPVISSAVNAQAVLGQPFTYIITATGNPQQFAAEPQGTAFPQPLPGTIALPNGLQVDTATGIISGTPTSLGFYIFIVSALNGGGMGTQQLLLTVIPPQVPVIASSSTASGIQNEQFSYTIVATNNPLSFGVTGALPAGLTLDDQTGIISGVAQVTGVYNLTQTATNAAGTGTRALTITINTPAIPVITSPLTASAQVNAAFEYDIKAANHPTSFNATGLPGGLTVDTTNGKITGTPNVQGVFNVTISAANLGGTGSATLQLTVNAQPIPVIISANQAAAFVGIPFTYTIAATAGPFTGFGATNLPPGLSINAAGTISGAASQVGTYTVTLSASNAVGTGTKTLTLTVTPPAAPIFTSPLPTATGIDGSAFTYTITATGVAPIIFTAAPLPQGLSLAGNSIVGTPAGGNTSVTLTAYSPATNPTFPGGPANPAGVPPTTATLTIQIAPTSAAVVNSILTATGTVGQPFSYPVQVSGTGPVTLTTSALPPGLTLIGNTIQGTPLSSAVTLNGPFPVTLTATNQYTTNPASKTLLITINAALPKFTSPAFAQGTDGKPFRYVIAATGTQVITYTVTTLPPGLTLNGNIIAGTPTSDAVGLTNVSVTATNKGGTTVLPLGILINAAPPVLTIPASVTGSAGVPFSFQLTATGSPQIDFQAPNLPAGLMVDTDKIDGTPLTAGTYNVVVSATNPAGTDNKTLQLIIVPAPPTITAAQINGFDGVPLAPFTLQVTGSAPISFSATGLPAGIVLDPVTGIFTGTPIGVGSTVATVTASNAGGTGTQSIVFNIAPSKPHITSPLTAQATPGVQFNYTITAAGTPVITFQVFNLPAGITANGSVISGVPTGPLGTISATIIATNAYGSDQQNLDITIAQTPPKITNTNLQANAQAGTPFTYTLTASGSPPIAFTATGLPPGLSLDGNTGIISGTPTVVGTYTVPVTALNQFGVDNKTLSIAVTAAPPKITSGGSATSGLNEPFTTTITATGTAPLTFGAKNLPPGLSVDPVTGIISGAPSVPGQQLFTVTATNSVGTDTKQFTLTVVPHPPMITSALTATASTTLPFTYKITAVGQPVITFTATNLPAGLVFSGDTISGIALATGVYSITLTANNPVGSDTETLVLTVTGDSDGDGFPDDFEQFVGTDPLNPNSNLFVGGKGNIRVLNVTTMRVKLDFKNAGKDSITARGTLQLDPGPTIGNQAVVYVSGVAAKISLATKPGAGNGFSLKSTRGRISGAATFTFSLSGDFKAKLALTGMTNENVRIPRTVSTAVLVFVDNTLYKSDKVLTYTAKQGSQGNAKQSN